jgi:hypothetical protein
MTSRGGFDRTTATRHGTQLVFKGIAHDRGSPMNRRLQLGLVIVSGTICFVIFALLLAAGPDACVDFVEACLAFPVERKRLWLANLHHGGTAIAIGSLSLAAVAALFVLARLHALGKKR